MQVFANSSLYGDGKEMEALLMNEVQLLAPAPSKLEQYTKQLQLFDLMFLFDDMAAAQRFQQSDKGRAMLKSMEDKGITGAYWLNGMRHFTANAAARRRPRAEIPRTALGPAGRPVHRPAGGAAQDGLRRDLPGPADRRSQCPGQSLVEHLQPEVPRGAEVHHRVRPRHRQLPADHQHRFWNGLPAEVRGELEAIIDEVTVEVNRQAEALNEKAKQGVIDSGKSEILVLTDEQRARWREAVQPAWKSSRARSARSSSRRPRQPTLRPEASPPMVC